MTTNNTDSLGPIPDDLAGFQHVEHGAIQFGDLLLPADMTGKQALQHALWADETVGSSVESYRRQLRVYRRMKVAKQGDTDNAFLEARRKTIQSFTPSPVVAEAAMAKEGILPTDAKARKNIPVYSGFIRYFPDAIAAVAKLSKIGNDQHNPGKPLHWDRSKSGDELDALSRHLTQAGTLDSDKVPHEVKIAWRGMANLQKAIEANPEFFAEFFSR